jgi:uncharacterized membrane protein
MMGFFSRVFFHGLLTVLPIALTLYVLWWLGSMSEAVLGPLLRLGLPNESYLPGMGLAAGVVLIFLVGLLVNARGISQLIGSGERLLNRLPLIKFIYGPMRDLMQFLVHPTFLWVAGSRSSPPQWKKMAMRKCSRLR